MRQTYEILGITYDQMVRSGIDLDVSDGARWLTDQNIDIDDRRAVEDALPPASDHYEYDRFIDAVVDLARWWAAGCPRDIADKIDPDGTSRLEIRPSAFLDGYQEAMQVIATMFAHVPKVHGLLCEIEAEVLKHSKAKQSEIVEKPLLDHSSWPEHIRSHIR
jgi:hypothetical protein